MRPTAECWTRWRRRQEGYTLDPAAGQAILYVNELATDSCNADRKLLLEEHPNKDRTR